MLPDLHTKWSRRLFNLAARPYAWMTWQETWRNHCGSLTTHFPSPSPTQSLRVLDLGIGPGVSGIAILDRRPDLSLVGVDFSEQMLRLAQGFVHRSGKVISLVRADGATLPFADDSFDIVTHHSFLYLVSDRNGVLREIRRVLKKSGHYVMLEPNEDGRVSVIVTLGGNLRFKLSMALWRVFSAQYGRFTETQLRTLLETHGFENVIMLPTLGGLGWIAHANGATQTANEPQ